MKNICCNICGCSFTSHDSNTGGTCPNYIGGEFNGWLDTVFVPDQDYFNILKSLVDTLKCSEDLRHALNLLEADVNYYGGAHLKEAWNTVSDYITKAEETMLKLNEI